MLLGASPSPSFADDEHPQVVIVTQPGAERARARLAEELALMGFQLSHERGDEARAEALVEDGSTRAVVWLRADRGEARLWVLDGDSIHSRSVEQDSSDSADLLALRSAELLRGRLLGSPSERSDEASGWSSGAAASGWGTSLGPALLMGATHGAALGVTGELMWRSSPELAVGPFFLGSLSPDRWKAGPDHYSERQLWAGAKLRLTWIRTADSHASEAWSSDVVLFGGVRTLFIDKSAPPDTHSSRTLTRPLIGVGAGASRHFGSTLRISWDANFGLGFPIDRASMERKGKGKEQEDASAEADFYFVLSVLAGLDW